MSKELEVLYTLKALLKCPKGFDEKIYDAYWEQIEQVLEHYNQIMSNDSGEAMKVFRKLIEHLLPYYNNPKHHYNLWTTSRVEQIKNFILQAQAKEQELAELKKKASKLRSREVCYHNNSRHYYDRKYHKGKAEVIDEIFGEKVE